MYVAASLPKAGTWMDRNEAEVGFRSMMELWSMKGTGGLADQGVFLFTVRLCWRGCPVVIGHMSPFDVHLATLRVSFQSSSFITGSLPANASLHEPSNRHHLLLFAPLQLTTWPIHINNDVY